MQFDHMNTTYKCSLQLPHYVMSSLATIKQYSDLMRAVTRAFQQCGRAQTNLRIRTV